MEEIGLVTTAPGDCFTNVSRALQINHMKIYNARNHIYGENGFGHVYKVSAWNSLEKYDAYKVSAWIAHEKYDFCKKKKFLKNIFESAWNICETTLWCLACI